MATNFSEVDIFRDSPLRYAGYLNEVGEAFRPLVPEFIVYLSYVAALSYVFADTASKGKAAADEQSGDFGCGQCAVLECLTFQMLASIHFVGQCLQIPSSYWPPFLPSDVSEY